MVVYTLVYASLSGPAIDLQKTPILTKKKSSFQMKLILNLAGMQKSKIVAFGALKIRTHTLKSRRRFWSIDIIGPFFFENEQGEALKSMAIIIGSC